MLQLGLWGWGGSAVWMLVLWLAQRRTGNAGIVDVGWATAIGALAVVYAILGPGSGARRALVGLMGGTWGARLSWHLLRDRVWGHPEEGRYVELRTRWAPRADRAFLLFFQAQALLAAVLSLPFLLAASGSVSAPRLTDGVGVALWITGIAGEWLADRQLGQWKADPANRGRTCRAGLWRFSRHPNYFFEWIIWCGFAVVGLGVPNGWLGLVAPGLILLFVTRITGIPPTEAQAVRSRGEDYRRYQREVSAFFPWFPKEGGG